MEQLNKIEIRGIVGDVRCLTAGDTKYARMQVATNYAFKNREGDAIVETTWHHVTAFEGKKIQGLEYLHKGSRVYVLGRLRCNRYTTVSGEERSFYEILANEIQILGGEE